LSDSSDSRDRHFRLCPDVRYRVVGGQAVIIVQNAGEAIVLNEMGTRILELIARESSSRQIADGLCEQFDVERAQAEQDLDGYLDDLVDAGVVEEAEPPDDHG
jgi:hypothetical protein